ncbi:MAG: hypothetical protein JW827_11275 [Spirochaetes bacterium]|nr:hypothetical protein [Spirochaetota bacterium]
MSSIPCYHFALAWSEYKETPFIKWLKRECKARKMKFYWCHDGNVKKTIRKIENREMKILFLLDMNATYNIPNDPYARLCYAVFDNDGTVLNDPDDAKEAVDKSITHYDFVKAGIPTPYTVIIRNWQPDKVKLTKKEKKQLKSPFVIKPATGFGRFGVITDAVWNIKKIARARAFNRGDNFLLQEKINPIMFNGNVAWFRVYYLYGEIIPNWWHPNTGVYRHVTMEEINQYRISPILNITRKIADVTYMEWFSTEIAFYGRGKGIKPVVVDYVNDQCDVDVQSNVSYAPPAEVVEHIAQRMVECAWKIQNNIKLQQGCQVWLA